MSEIVSQSQSQQIICQVVLLDIIFHPKLSLRKALGNIIFHKVSPSALLFVYAQRVGFFSENNEILKLLPRQEKKMFY